MMYFYIYILKLFDESLYTGYTNDLQRRLQEHRYGIGSRYVKGRRPFELVYLERIDGTISDAMKRERAIKKLTREQKKKLIYKTHKDTKNGL